MCQIISRSIDAETVPEGILNREIERNNDGWGIMYSAKDKLSVIKSLDMKDFENTFRDFEKANMSFVAHLRLGTHGTKTIDNVHPFEIHGGRAALVHNGVLHRLEIVDKAKSDTWHFAQLLDQLPEDFIHSEKAISWLNKIMLDTFNKIVIMDEKGTRFHLGTGYENHTKGIWYSTYPYSGWDYCRGDYSSRTRGTVSMYDKSPTTAESVKQRYWMGRQQLTIPQLKNLKFNELKQLGMKNPHDMACLVQKLLESHHDRSNQS